MSRLHPLPGDGPVESAALTQRLSTAHAVHAYAARLAPLENGVVALSATDILHEQCVAPPQVRRNLLSLAPARPILISRTKRFAILPRL